MSSTNGDTSKSGTTFDGFFRYLKNYLYDVVDLKKGVDSVATIRDIKSKSSLSGANSWMLMCSIVIASIGLGQNSQALIIGAMLISPLMSPILGIGLSVGINDMQTLKTCLIHFAIAIVIAVLTSYVYFELTPFKVLTPEIDARTEPTFLDIFVAIFGGLAGIISIARKDISTTLPGVAIATALMPPLCVTGYGIATGNLEIAVTSFYLFFLNTFFVAFATYLVVRYLQFPYRKFVNRAKERKNIFLTVGFSLALIAPSFYIFNLVHKNHRIEVSLGDFRKTCLGEDDIYLDSYTLGDLDDIGHRTLYLKVYGDVISQDKIPVYEDCINSRSEEIFDIKIISTSEVQLDHVKGIEDDLETIVSELESKELEAKRALDIVAYHRLSHIDTSLFDHVIDELKTLYPDIEEIGLSYAHLSDVDEKASYDIPTLMLKWDKIKNRHVSERLVTFVEKRLSVDSIKLIQY